MSHETSSSLEKDGYRAQLVVHTGDRALLRSRQGTDMTGSFPEIREAALAQLPADTGLDGELVVWESDRLAFERLQQRLARRGTGAVETARQWPAHYVVFDLVHADRDVTGWPYARRRAALESLFADRHLEAPLTLCPSTTDPAVARERLEWSAAGLEGLCFKRLDELYFRHGRGGSTRSGPPPKRWSVPSPVPPRRPGPCCWAATTPRAACSTPGTAPHCPRPPAARWPTCWSRRRVRHTWRGWTFSAGWGTQRALDVLLVEPYVVMEVASDVARDSAGRWRHPVRPLVRTSPRAVSTARCSVSETMPK
ncbi:ATP-dependent DNA ligase [Streptomyces eurythermus]|uniref:ATP-dependent DNA ligase n=1 Tax=Streptomyces eurythermus TaxID=42237 RepID=UPI0036D35BE1